MVLRLFKITKGARGILFFKALLGLLMTATYVTQAILLGKGVNYAFHDPSWDNFLPIIFGVAAMVGLRAVLLCLIESIGKLAAGKVKESIRVNLFDHFFQLGPGFMDEERTGKVESVFIDGVEALEVFLCNYIPQAMVTIVGLLLIVSYIFTMDVTIGALITVCVIVSVVSPTLWDKVMHSVGDNHWESYGDLNSQFVDAMQGMTTLKAFNASDEMGDTLEGQAGKLYHATMKKLNISLLSTSCVSFVSAVGTSLSIGLGAYHLCLGTITVASLTTILFLTTECFRPINDLNTYWHQSFLGFSAAEKMFEFMDTPVTVKNTVRPDLKLGVDAPTWVQFSDVSFSYNAEKGTALKHFSAQIPDKSKVALVGKSGAGKSTVVNLLLRFFDCQEGEILLSGRNIRDFDIRYLRSLISVVFQDTYLFYGTVAENIRLARMDASMEEIEHCCKLANAHQFISELPDGYETIIGERGVRLSGGERQRISIARAILKNAPLLVLDEATSNVDATNESMIQQSLDLLMLEKTTLVIAHRLSTILNSQEVFVLEDGQVVEHGRAEELLETDGAFSALISAQKAGEEGAR